MKLRISQLITELNFLKDSWGDVPVWFDGKDGETPHLTIVTELKAVGSSEADHITIGELSPPECGNCNRYLEQEDGDDAYERPLWCPDCETTFCPDCFEELRHFSGMKDEKGAIPPFFYCDACGNYYWEK